MYLTIFTAAMNSFWDNWCMTVNPIRAVITFDSHKI